MEGVPERGSNNPEAEVEKTKTIERAQEIYSELLKYDGQEVDRATHHRIKSLNSQLHGLMMSDDLTWKDLTDNGLPWDPRLEMLRQQKGAANDDHSAVNKAA